VRNSARIVHDEAGTPLFWQGFITDISQQKQAQAALQQREARFRSLVQHATDMVCIMDADGNLVYQSPSIERQMGYTPAEIVGMPATFWLHPDELPAIQAFLSDIVAEPGSVRPFVYRCLHKDGSWRWIDASVTNLLDDPAIRGIVINSRDITERKASDEQIRFQAGLLDTVEQAVIATDMTGTAIYWNRSAEELYGWTRDEVLGRKVNELVVPQMSRLQASEIITQLHAGTSWSGEFLVQRRDETTFWVHVTGSPIHDSAGSLIGIVGVSTDISADRLQREQLTEVSATLQTMIDAAPLAVITLDNDHVVTSWNPAAERLFGWTADEAIGQHTPIVPPDQTASFLAARSVTMAAESAVIDRDAQRQTKDGRMVDVSVSSAPLRRPDGDTYASIAMITDITHRKDLESALIRQAFHDNLTGLPNRALMRDRIAHALLLARRNGAAVAVLFLDLDNFKVVNDTLGHMIGDQLLIDVARRLSAHIRESDTIARFGGDEFVILLSSVDRIDAAVEIGARIRAMFADPFVIDGREMLVETSLGIAIETDGTATPDDLLRQADEAMYQAKALGKNQYALYDRSTHTAMLNRLALESDLRGAPVRNELVVHYQPKVSLVTGRPIGMEALVRWQHPERGLVAPGAFIPIAEATGLIVPLGTWVLREACRQTAEWNRRNDADAAVGISVNLSARQFAQSSLEEQVRSILDETRLDPTCLTLELTESVIMDDAEEAVTRLHALKALGIRIAIDDFGTGYSSLAYLKRFPIDVIKIDRSFVSGMEESSEDTAIVSSIIGLAYMLGKTVVAKGVETARQLVLLRNMGCDRGQGYFFGRPGPPTLTAFVPDSDPDAGDAS